MTDVNVEQCRRFLCAHRIGELQFAEHMQSIKFVIAPDGRLVAPVMVAMLQALETVLFVPMATLEDDDHMQLLVTLYQFNEQGPDGGLADKWRIYHGDPPDVQWAFLDIDAAKFQNAVIDGEAMMQDNPLIPIEPQVCTQLNRQTDALRTLALHHAHLEIAHPMLVGVDPLGYDVRGQFDIARIHATRPLIDAEDAIAHFDELLLEVQDQPHPAKAMPERDSQGEQNDS
ncbi:MAG: hypothetical protein O7G85_16465 [Planctomycetota bacterium]|nr:hypothetical protein [Planctomycetota bacterium]